MKHTTQDTLGHGRDFERLKGAFFTEGSHNSAPPMNNHLGMQIHSSRSSDISRRTRKFRLVCEVT